MLTSIRKLVYHMGIRPKYGTVLYSPSQDSQLVGKELIESFIQGLEQGSQDAIDTVEITTRQSLYDSMQFCVICGKKLEAIVLDVKDCPDKHGRTFTSENDEGLPIICFQSRD